MDTSGHDTWEYNGYEIYSGMEWLVWDTEWQQAQTRQWRSHTNYTGVFYQRGQGLISAYLPESTADVVVEYIVSGSFSISTVGRDTNIEITMHTKLQYRNIHETVVRPVVTKQPKLKYVSYTDESDTIWLHQDDTQRTHLYPYDGAQYYSIYWKAEKTALPAPGECTEMTVTFSMEVVGQSRHPDNLSNFMSPIAIVVDLKTGGITEKYSQ